jgi:hypothetical protein
MARLRTRPSLAIDGVPSMGSGRCLNCHYDAGAAVSESSLSNCTAFGSQSAKSAPRYKSQYELKAGRHRKSARPAGPLRQPLA